MLLLPSLTRMSMSSRVAWLSAPPNSTSPRPTGTEQVRALRKPIYGGSLLLERAPNISSHILLPSRFAAVLCPTVCWTYMYSAVSTYPTYVRPPKDPAHSSYRDESSIKRRPCRHMRAVNGRAIATRIHVRAVLKSATFQCNQNRTTNSRNS
jgi:hypothetical protein